jgi:polyribonucleotide nucleotidyltransferase
VRVARIDGKLIINPPFPDIEKADIDLIVAGNADNILMVEGEMNEVSEAEIGGSIEVRQSSHSTAMQSPARIQRDGRQYTQARILSRGKR